MKESTQKLYEERLLRVLVFIQQNLDEPMPLEELARVAHFSPYHFHRIFRGMVGESLKEHIRRLRLERAALRLKHTDRSVLDIALEAGFQTHESFTRAFGALLGCSPSQFRSNNTIAFTAPGVHFQNGVVETQNLRSQLLSGGAIMEVKIERLEPLRVAFVRHVGPYNEVGQAWETLCMRLGRKGLIGPDSRFVGVCHDDPEVTAPEKIRYDACITVGEDFTPEGEVGVQMLPGGEFAVVTHSGPYENLNQTYAALFGQWLPHSGRELRSEPSLEFYLNDPESTDPEDLLTDIYAPLQPLS
ncbi:MAG: AraC family transcriptional regulator [Sedimentisphaerales bacterium]|nr:AraC family transcriptional regulator [Sedimentisphaerales bacterium]